VDRAVMDVIGEALAWTQRCRGRCGKIWQSDGIHVKIHRFGFKDLVAEGFIDGPQ
jgi:hypothetical protein